GDQVVAAVDLGVAFERNSQGADLPDQVRGHRSVWRVEGDVDCAPDGRPALLGGRRRRFRRKWLRRSRLFAPNRALRAIIATPSPSKIFSRNPLPFKPFGVIHVMTAQSAAKGEPL